MLRLIMGRWLLLAAVVCGLDQFTKALAAGYLELHRPLALIPGLQFRLTYNSGAAFSFLSDASGWQRWFFIGITLLICSFILAWLYRLQKAEFWSGVALGLVLGGALGNLWDRLALGAVLDFIDVYYGQWHWPAFNLADSAISVGAVILILVSLGEEKSE